MGPATLLAQGQRERLAGWNASFAIPSGWRVLQVAGRAAALTDSLESGALFVSAAYVATPVEAQAELTAMFADLHYTATATAAPTDTIIGGHRAMVATYQGAGRAGPVATRVAVVFSDYGTGITIVGLGPPERFTQVADVVGRVAATVQAELPATNVAWVAALSGHWDYVPPASAVRDSSAAGRVAIEEWLEFDGHERYRWRSRTVVSVRGANPLTAENQDDTGTYTVVGSTLVLRGKRTRTVDIRLNADDLSLSGRGFRRKHP